MEWKASKAWQTWTMSRVKVSINKIRTLRTGDVRGRVAETPKQVWGLGFFLCNGKIVCVLVTGLALHARNCQVRTGSKRSKKFVALGS